MSRAEVPAPEVSHMRKMMSISTVALLLGAPMAMAQTMPASRDAARADMRAGTVIPPQRDPDSTNRSQQVGPLHEDFNNRGAVTGPLGPSANGG